jgi:ubiquinone/menaquinone biosynthesis C-methylase UbiE
MKTSSCAAALAFDAIASQFDVRFGEWESVAAQRRAVRAALLRSFPQGGYILELGGGTGADASFLGEHGFEVLLTDPSPTMVRIARSKLIRFGSEAALVAAEELEEFGASHLSVNGRLFDGAFSNFAPLNCVANLDSVARGLARLLKPGALAMLVLFGTLCPGEMLTELLRGRPSQALRRFRRGNVEARLGQHQFAVTYHRRAAVTRAFAPWFVLEGQLGIGITVPPSAAEPWISRYPHLLSTMESLDSVLSHSFARFADHILYQFRRNS